MRHLGSAAFEAPFDLIAGGWFILARAKPAVE